MKQAVVLIHGIGEQKPMATLRSFVAAILGPGADGRPAYFSKPDPMSELFELRRLQAVGRPTTHFFEYYWAYNVEGTTVGPVLRWLGGLILRSRRDVPDSAKAIWWVARAVVVLTVILALVSLPTGLRAWIGAQAEGLTMAWLAIVGVALAAQAVVVSYLGDAARYLSPKPANIRLRRAIRAEGVQLLRSLHQTGGYDRIVIVGHSLGSVIGYDLITHLWQEHNEQYPGLDDPGVQARVRDCLDRGVSAQPVVRDLLSARGEAIDPRSDAGLQPFRRAQRHAWREQRTLGNPWRISDFITIGSPLAHAMLLLADSGDDFENRKRQRELPTCPPQRDQKGYAYSGPTPLDVGGGRKFTPLVLHHAAPFAVTRWTNLYVRARLGLFGDLVGGPLRPVFGPGILDLPVRTTALRGLATHTLLAHTRYWHGADAVEPSAAAANPTSGERPHLALRTLKQALLLTSLRSFRPTDWPQLRQSGAARRPSARESQPGRPPVEPVLTQNMGAEPPDRAGTE